MTQWIRDVFALIKDQQQWQGQLPISSLNRMKDDLTRHDDDLNYVVSGFRNAQHHNLLHVKIDGQLFMVCQRCLEELVQPIAVDNTLRIVESEAELDSEEDEIEAIMAGDVSPEKMVGSKEFDLHALLEDEVILGLPMIVTHEVCEQKLPTEAGQKASPFDVLAKLKQ